ncbi:hypothetical protein D3C73_1388900 [compost metagenome]
MNDAAIAFADGGARAFEQVAAILHRLQVAARRKGPPGAGQHHAADGGVGVDGVASSGEGLAVLQVRQGVQSIGPIQGPDHDRARALLDDQTHAAFPFTSEAAGFGHRAARWQGRN